MVLFAQLLAVAICGGFLVVVVRDWARTNILLVRNDRQALLIQLGAESRRAEGYPEGYFSKHHARREAVRYLLNQAEARVERVKRWGF